jgi:hypothetical protein
MNMDMRKTLIAIAFFLASSFCGHAQFYDSTELTFVGGYGKLERLVLNESTESDVLQNDSFYKTPYMFYQVIFNVSKDGRIGDIWINSLFDTALVGSILTAMKKTNGLWVNNSGVALVAVLPIYYNNVSNDTLGDLMFKQIYDRIDNTKSVKIFSSFYQNWKPRKIVLLKAIKIVSLPPVHKPGNIRKS